MKIKKITIITTIILIFIIGICVIYNNQKDLKESCTDPNNLDYVNICMQRGKLYNQEQYDVYYNIATNHPSLSILKDDLFYQGFRLAYNNCSVNSRPTPCNKHDKKVIDNFAEQCTANTEKKLFCTTDYFNENIPNKDNINYFSKIVQHQINENKTKEYLPLNWNCMDSYKLFYSKIGTDLIDLVPLEVKKVCGEN